MSWDALPWKRWAVRLQTDKRDTSAKTWKITAAITVQYQVQ